MNWRFFFVTIVCGLALATNLVLVLQEDVATVDQKKRDDRRQDVLYSMKFAADQRTVNLQKMGFDPEEIKEILALVVGLGNQFHVDEPDLNVIRARIDATPDQASLTSALCGTGASGSSGGVLPVRYEALRYLVVEEGGQRSVINLSEVRSIEYQDWATSSRIDAVFESAELGADRPSDATRMALAAILAGQQGEGDFLDHRGGWGGVVMASWSWEKVQKTYPGVRRRVEEYVALMLLCAEEAHTEGGLCREEAAAPEGEKQ